MDPQARVSEAPSALWLPLGGLLLAASALYLSFFNAFTVPEIDFFALRDSTIRYFHSIPLWTFTWLPLFPLLTGVISLVMPGPQPILLAAEVMNLLLAPVCLWLVYRIARRFLSLKASFAVTALCAVNPAMLYCATQPLLEMLLLTMILLVVELSLRGSRWAYAAVFLASMTRYEAVLLIPAVVLQDLRSETVTDKRWRVLLGALASVGIVTWMMLSLAHRGMGNLYVEQLRADAGIYGAFVLGSLRVAADVVPAELMHLDVLRWLVLLLISVLLVVGLTALIRRHRSSAIATLVFFSTYVVIHGLYPAFQPRYVLPILWIIYVGMAKGVETLMDVRARVGSHAAVAGESIWARGMWIIGVGGVLAYTGVRIAQQGPVSLLVFALFCAATLLLWDRAGRLGQRRRMSVRAVPALVLCVILGSGIRSSSSVMQTEAIKENLAHFKTVGQWYQRAAKPGDKMLVPLPWAVEYYSQLPGEYFLDTLRLESSSLGGLVDELRERDVTYVLWGSGRWLDERWFHAIRFKGPLVSLLKERAPETLEVVEQVRVGSNEAIVYRFHAPASEHVKSGRPGQVRMDREGAHVVFTGTSPGVYRASTKLTRDLTRQFLAGQAGG